MITLPDFFSEANIMTSQPVHILLVEDDEVDVEVVKRAFATLKIENPMTTVHDGQEALDALRGAHGYEPVPRPCIILLDLNMPRMSGLEFLHELRRDPQLKSSVVFVLTTSSSEADMVAAYNLHVAGYFLKSLVGEEVLNLPRMMSNYWRMVVFPNMVGQEE
jgi:CheY-like chemotaxis protein